MNKDKKVLIRFILLMIVCTAVGGVSGYAMAVSGQSAAAMLNKVMGLIWKISHLLCFAGALMLCVGIVYYYKGIKVMKLSLNDMDNEELLNKADSTLTTALTCISQCSMITMVFYGITMPGCFLDMDLTPWPLFMAETIVFILVLIVSTVYQVKVVDAVKRMYPEKKGNVLDTKFVKDWFDSCDEAERQMIGQASYFSYRAVTMTSLALLVVSILVSSTLQLGPFPTLAIGIIMMVSTFSYLYKSRMLEKGKRR